MKGRYTGKQSVPATSIVRRALWATALMLMVTATYAVDSDGDGVDDSIDAFPSDACASVDTDGDGQPNAFTRNSQCFYENFENGFANYPWQGTGGTQGWVITSGGQEGKAANERKGQQTLRVTHTFAANTVLTFYFKNQSVLGLCSPATGTFTGGVTSVTLQGSVSTWTKKSVQVNAGTRTLAWQ